MMTISVLKFIVATMVKALGFKMSRKDKYLLAEILSLDFSIGDLAYEIAIIILGKCDEIDVELYKKILAKEDYKSIFDRIFTILAKIE